MAKGKRVAIEPNIYRYELTGVLEGRAFVTGLPPKSRRYPPGTRLERIRAWVAVTKTDLENELRTFGTLAPRAQRFAGGTLEGDAPAFFKEIAGREGFKADRSHVRAWFDVVVDGQRLGALERTAWTSSHVNQAIAQWQAKPSPHAVRKVRVGGYERAAVTVEEFAITGTTVRAHRRLGAQAGPITSYVRRGSTIAAHERPAYTVPGYVRSAPATSGRVVSALTIRHRCRVLADLFHTLDGASAPTPVDEAKVPKRPKRPPVTVPASVIESTLTTLARTDKVTFAQFAVVATTGQRPCQVGRALPEDVDLVDRVWFVRDAKGEPAHSITLEDPQVAAWEAFVVADAWGPIDTGKYGKRIHAAGWPKGIRPYAARHSIAVTAIRSGVNLGDVQAMLGHGDPRTTRIYAPFVIDRQREVSQKMKDYLANVFKLRRVK